MVDNGKDFNPLTPEEEEPGQEHFTPLTGADEDDRYQEWEQYDPVTGQFRPPPKYRPPHGKSRKSQEKIPPRTVVIKTNKEQPPHSNDADFAIARQQAANPQYQDYLNRAMSGYFLDEKDLTAEVAEEKNTTSATLTHQPTGLSATQQARTRTEAVKHARTALKKKLKNHVAALQTHLTIPITAENLAQLSAV